MVANGIGYLVLITRPTGNLTYDGRTVAYVPLTDTVEPASIVLAHPARGRPTRLLELFAKHCVVHFSETPPPGDGPPARSPQIRTKLP